MKKLIDKILILLLTFISINVCFRYINPRLESFLPVTVGIGTGISMSPTQGKLALEFAKGSKYESKIERGMIVSVSNRNEDNPKEILQKRVIGLPGETIQIIDGTPYINNVPLDEPYVLEENNILNRNLNPITLSENEYYVLGDNRDHSWDSRFIGPVNKEDIIGISIFHLNILR